MHCRRHFRVNVMRLGRLCPQPLSACGQAYHYALYKLNPLSSLAAAPSTTASAGNDALGGSAGDDIIDGGAGNDDLFGGGKDDGLFGGIGNDKLWGGDATEADLGGTYHGSDYLDGGGGDDNLIGGQGGDVLLGEVGNDTLDSGDGADYLAGGAGDDSYLNVTSLDTVDDTEGNNILRFDQSAGLVASNALSVTDGGTTLHVALNNGETIKLQNAPFGMNASLEFSNGDSLDLENLVGTTLATPRYLAMDDSGGRLYGRAGDESEWRKAA